MDERALVTGCTSGIGPRLVGALAEAGHRVRATDLDAEALRETAAADGWAPDRVRTAPLDVTDPAAWERELDALEADWGAVDVVVHNAGVIQPRLLLDTSIEEIDRQLAVDLRAVMVGTRAAVRRMAPRRAGHVIAINSLTGLAPTPGMTVYSGAKFGARGFLLGVGQEVAPLGIAVTVVARTGSTPRWRGSRPGSRPRPPSPSPGGGSGRRTRWHGRCCARSAPDRSRCWCRSGAAGCAGSPPRCPAWRRR
jgi:NAD(P)-dependent dehydrogenase (short-subunit alcohol dehydrogenase family)